MRRLALAILLSALTSAAQTSPLPPDLQGLPRRGKHPREIEDHHPRWNHGFIGADQSYPGQDRQGGR